MSDVSTQTFWQSLYEKGRTGWDLGGPAPTFQRIVEEEWFERGRMIVVGAGRGYDARLFARHGYQVTAVDFAPAAIRAMQDRNALEAPLAIIQADIFALKPLLYGIFDYVLEYVFYCAIDPLQREAYASVVARLLKPGGRFIGLLFPTSAQESGPPYQVDPEELAALLQAHAFRVEHREVPSDSVSPRRGREELLIMKKDPQFDRPG